jgi:hypothetical protein
VQTWWPHLKVRTQAKEAFVKYATVTFYAVCVKISFFKVLA